MTFPEGEQADTNQIENCFRPTREDIKSMTFPEGEQANTSQKKNCLKPTWEDIQSMTFPEGEAQKVKGNPKSVVVSNTGPSLPTGCFFLDPPSWEAIQLAFPEGKEVQRKRFPLNIKRVQQACLIKTEQLDSFDKQCLSFFREHTRIVNDEVFYKEKLKETKMKASELQKPALSIKELESLMDYKIEKASEMPIFGTFGFKIAEPHKQRCRPIFDCRLNNVFITTPKYSLKNKETIREQLNGEGIVFLQFDFKSYYDQFLLKKEIRKYFGFKDHDGLPCVLRLLPMGFRLAVACAQSTTWQLLNFRFTGSAEAITCIDNVCFTGKKEDVFQTAHTFLLRVEECGFTLNGFEEDKYTNLNEREKSQKLEALIEEQPEFLGEHYDLNAKTRRVTSKTIQKLKLVWGILLPRLETNFKLVSNRQFFCLFGLIGFATGILNINTCIFFNLLKKMRRMSSKLTQEENLWDKPLLFDFTVLEIALLKKWVAIIIQNEPVHLTAGRKERICVSEVKADIYVILDASKLGWGAVLFNERKEFLFCLKGKWPKKEEEFYESSVRAESKGMEEVLEKIKTWCNNRTVVILTDHENLVFASQSMYVHNYFYNKALTKVEQVEREHECRIKLYFLQGVHNNADNISRGLGLDPKDKIFPLHGMRTEGDGVVKALTPPWQI